MMLVFAGLSFYGLKERNDSPKPDKSIVTAKAAPAVSVPEVSPFEQAVEIIKKYEGLHSPRHWPLVGYGHKVLPGERYSRRRALSQEEAEALLRKDLHKKCAAFREFGADSLLLGVLAYNIGSGATRRSSVVKKLRAGDRDIKANYIAHCRYRGKEHARIKQRRTEEFATFFIKNPDQEEGLEMNLASTVSGTVSAGRNNENNIQNL